MQAIAIPKTISLIIYIMLNSILRLANHVDEQDDNGENSSPCPCHEEPLSQADLMRTKARRDKDQEPKQGNQRNDLIFVHAAISNPS